MTSPTSMFWPNDFLPSSSVTSESQSPLPGSSPAMISTGSSLASPSISHIGPHPLLHEQYRASRKFRMRPLRQWQPARSEISCSIAVTVRGGRYSSSALPYDEDGASRCQPCGNHRFPSSLQESVAFWGTQQTTFG